MDKQNRKHIIDELENRKKVFNAGAKKGAKASFIFGGACLVICIVIGVIIGQIIIGIVAGIIIGAVVAIVKYNVDLKKLDNDIEKEVGEKLLDPWLNEFFKDVKRDVPGDLDAEEMGNLQLFSSFNECMDLYYLSAKYSDIPFVYASMSITHKEVSHNDDGESQEDIEIIFSGTVTRIELDKTYDDNIIIYTNKFKYNGFGTPRKKNPKERISTEAVEFDDNFYIFGENKVEALSVLSPGTMSALLDLKNELGQEFALVYKDNYLYFFVMDENIPTKFNQLDKKSIQEQLDLITAETQAFAKRMEKVNQVCAK